VLGTTDQITVSSFFADPLSRIERVEFADGTAWDMATLAAAKYLGTDGHDYLGGTDDSEVFEVGGSDDMVMAAGGDDIVNGGAGNDSLYGNSDNDSLDGEDGDDYLTGGSGNDTLDGGTGIDYLSGDDGADTYHFSRGFGQDTIYEYDGGSGGQDIIRFAADILPGEVELSRNGSDLFLKVLGTTDQITVSSFFADPLSRIERVEFADGTAWADSTLLAAKFMGTESADYIYGTSGNDSIEGCGGDDYLYGDGGADTLDGGAGNDTYLFGRGSGADFISDYDPTAGNTDVLSIGSDVAADQLWFRRVGSDLEVSIIGGTDKSTISNWYAGSSYHVEQFKTSDGKLLLDSQVDALVSAMAAFAPPAAGQTTLPPAYQTSLAPVIAANWQ
jgi:Ca2+-binding RTX toxin-like protein